MKKTFNQHLYERDIAWKKSASVLVFGENLYATKIPFSTPIYRRTFGNIPRTTVFHIANPETFQSLIKLEGKKKSISALTYAAPIQIMNGINQLGGLAVEMEADVLVSHRVDIMSVPDKTGRRWVSFADLEEIIRYNNYENADTIISAMEKDITTLIAALVTKHMNNPIISNDVVVFNLLKKKMAGRKYFDAWYYLNPDSIKATNPAAQKKVRQFQNVLIKDYLDGIESVMKKNAKGLGKAISAYLLERATTAGKGGEVFIPKLLAYRVGDLKDVLLDLFESKNSTEIISVRPGEKFHESLLTIDELRNAYESKHDYILIEKNDFHKIHAHNYEKTSLNEQYSSDKVKLLTKNELKNILLKEDYI